MPDTRQKAEEIVEEFSDHLDLDVEDVEERFDELVNEYKVPVNEATQSIRNSYLDEANLNDDDLDPTDNELILSGEIDKDEQWVEMNVKVVELWEPTSDSISQTGLIGDEDGRIRFVSFETSDLPDLEEGKSYNLKNIVTDEYQGNYSVKLNRTTEITELEEDIEVGENTKTIEGALVDIQSGSGLIKRCPKENCTRVLQNGRCSEHGEVDGEFDMRIKAVLDDGTGIEEVIFNREATEELAGINMEEAKQMAMDALDTTVVADDIKEKLIGKYFRVSGREIGRYVAGNEFEQITGPTQTDVDNILVKARSI